MGAYLQSRFRIKHFAVLEETIFHPYHRDGKTQLYASKCI